MVRRLLRFLDAESAATGLSLRPLLATALAIHVWVTLLAVNPWHPDEHYQILEFAWSRAGLAPFEGLPWEWNARIRPTLQPAMALFWLETLRFAGVESPFVWVTTLRLASLLLAFGTLLAVVAHASPSLTPAGRRTLWLTAFLLWFTPFFLGRFTSENWGGMAFAAGLVLALRTGGTRRDLASGALLGLAFVFRSQMALAILPVLVWVGFASGEGVPVATGRARGAFAPGLHRVGRMIVASAAVVAAGTLLDTWFYGAWVFTPWRYFSVNLLEGVASSFGVSPWWTYFLWLVAWPTPPVGIALILVVLAGTLARPRSPWGWALVGFLLGHSLIAHKEVRFLLPLLYLAPVLAAWGVEAMPRWRVLRGAAYAVLVYNTALFALPATPGRHSGLGVDWHYCRALWNHAEAYPEGPVFVLAEDGDAYGTGAPRTLSVYRHPRVIGVEHRAGDPVPPGVPADTPPERLLILTRNHREPLIEGAVAAAPFYRTESGWRTMARLVGVEHARWIQWLDDWDGWTDSEGLLRLHEIHRSAARRETDP